MVSAPTPRPYDPLFDDAWLKLGWGFQHAKRVYTELERFQDLQNKSTGGVTLGGEYEPEAKRFVLKVAGLKPVPKRFSLLLADVLHCYRSALDAAVWAAVKRGTQANSLADHERNRVAFPDILVKLNYPKFRSLRDQFTNDTLPFRAPGISRPDATVLRRAQRFDLPKKARAIEPLALLVEKNNIDKHKALEVLSRVHAEGSTIQVVNQRDCIVRRIEPRTVVGEVLQVGAELCEIFVTPTGPNPDVNVQARFTNQIALEHVPDVMTFLNELGFFVERVLSGFSAGPADGTTQLLGL